MLWNFFTPPDFFLEKNENCLELPDLARKLIRKYFEFFLPPPPDFIFFFEKNEKFLKLPDLAKKFIKKII